MNLYKHIRNNKKVFLNILSQKFPQLILFNSSSIDIFKIKNSNECCIGSVDENGKFYTPIFYIIDRNISSDWFFDNSLNLVYVGGECLQKDIFNFSKSYENNIIRKEKLKRLLYETC